MSAARWYAMLFVLQGLTATPLPEVARGRRYRPLGEIPDADPMAEQWDAEHRRATEQHAPCEPQRAQTREGGANV